jgi:hypothetical protein
MNQLVSITASTNLPALIAVAGDRASRRFLEFFAANIRNPHTRRAYGRAVAEFLAWCDEKQVPAIDAVQPLHVAAWIELQQQERAAPTVKLRLAALRHLFDRLVGLDPTVVSPEATSPEKGCCGSRRDSSDFHDNVLRHDKWRIPVGSRFVAKLEDFATGTDLCHLYRPLIQMALGDTTVGSRPGHRASWYAGLHARPSPARVPARRHWRDRL